MNILEHLDKTHLHHAYLIEGKREEVIPKIKKFIESLGIKTIGNPDFYHISIDSFKIEDARNIKSYATEKGFSSNKKIFIISANSFLLEAQNSLLKMFEEPIHSTHFFIVIPDVNSLLKTLISRFYLIRSKTGLKNELDQAEKFIKMSLKNRIDFIKDLLTESEEKDEGGNEVVVLDSTRSKALKFLNALESILHQKFILRMPLNNDLNFFKQIFQVREFLRIPGSSVKTLMESVALVVPNF